MYTTTNSIRLILPWCLLLGIMVSFSSCRKPSEAFTGFQKPENFPEPTYPFASNPVTEDGFKLGRKLFYDGRLSRDGSISCGSCHIQYSAFTQHGHDVSHGIDDLLGRRNSPSLQNLAWGVSFFWDGGVHNLDMVPFNAITSPVEMDETVPNVLEKLRNDAEYRKLFKAAFGTEDVNSARMMQALSQFMVMLISSNSPYDRYMRGNQSVLSADEQEGLILFRTKCSSCHTEPFFTDETYRNNGIDTSANDYGRFEVSTFESDKFKFKVPSLRNLHYTEPYMHDGSFNSLDAVLEHYRSGITHSSTLDPLLQNGIPMTDEEKNKIIAFLQTLNDEEFVKNTLFSEQ